MDTQRAEDRSRSEATLRSDGHFCVHLEKIHVNLCIYKSVDFPFNYLKVDSGSV